MDPAYCVSIICYNRLELTRRCLDTVRLHSPPDTQLILTNNASTDGTAEYLREVAGQDHRVQLVCNQSNLGVGPPKRAAAALCRAPYFASLDNDAWVGPGWLRRMRMPMEHDAGLVQIGRTGTCQHLGNSGEGGPGGPVEYIDGSVFMVRAKLLERFPVCDPLYPFAYCDDSDFSLRLRAHGYRIAVHSIPVWHPDGEEHKQQHGGVDLSSYNHQSRVAFERRWHDYLQRRAFDPTVALRRAGALGDVLLCTPLATRLKELWPQSTIFFGTSMPDAVASHPAVDHVVTLADWDKLTVAYRWVLDGAYEQNVGINYSTSLLRYLGIFADQPLPDPPEFRVEPGSTVLCRRLVPNEERKPLAVVCLQQTTWEGKNCIAKDWWPALEVLADAGYLVVEVGTGEPQFEGTADHYVNLCGRTSIPEMAALLLRSHLFLGLEAGPAHLAQALGTVAVVHFGCTLPSRVATRTDRLIPVTLEGLDCLGCHHNNPQPGVTSFRGCSRKDLMCCQPGVVAVLESVRAGREMAERYWGKEERTV